MTKENLSAWPLRLPLYRVDTEHFASLCRNSVEVGIEVLRIDLVKDP